MRWFFLILLVLNIALFAWFQQEQELRNKVANRVEFSGAGVETIKLLSEMPIQLRKRPNGDAGASLPDGANDTGLISESKETCLYLLGFASVEASREFLLSQLSNRFHGRVVQLPVTETEYWVYVRAPEGVQQRRQVQQSLQDQGYEVSVARQGELSGQLSLGLFQRRELALALYESLKQRNYDVDIFELPQNKTISAVQVDGRKDGMPMKPAEYNLIANLVAADPQLKSEKKLCEGVASG